MHVVIVESPAKAKTINKYLGNDFKVIASFGHIRDLPSKDGSVEPDNDFAMHYEISSKSTKHVKEIADAIANAQSIYLATDPDREGEAISWHIIEAMKKRRKLKKSIPIHRVVFHEITKKAVLDAIHNPRQLDMNLVNAQQARRALDYLVGFNISPVLWRKLPGSRSAGRVQSVALRLVCEREHEIEIFQSQEYWSIALHLLTPNNEPFIAKLTHVNDNKLEQFDITTQEDAQKLVKQLQGYDYTVTNIEQKQVRRNPYAPFTTSSLQQDASRKLGFGAKKTMMVAQKLYEGIPVNGENVGLITYMRTDSVTTSKEAIAQTRDLIGNMYGNNYVPKSPRMYQSKAKNAQEAHEAIRPTDMTRTPKDMSHFLDTDQERLYKLIWERMMASQMEPAILNQVAATISANDNKATARATGSTVHFDGFYRVYREGTDDDKQDSDNDERMLPALANHDALGLNTVEPNQHFTQPPPRYTEASLVKKLEELGIGRPSTYASIISVLQDRNYVRLEKKRFMAEDRGRIVTAFLESFFTKYVEYDFTANLEEELDNISNGSIEWKEVLATFWKDFHTNVEEASNHTITEVIHELNQLLADYLFPKDEEGAVNRNCPSCSDGKLSLKLGKFGAFLGCSNYPDCNYTKPLASDDEQPEGQAGDANPNEPKLLGQDPETGSDVTLRKGPYGWYIQLGEAEGKTKPKRAGVPKTQDPSALSFDEALGLLSLPREVGTHPETGKKISAGIGRFGPYLLHDGKYTSLKEDDVLTVGMNRAVTLISQTAQKKGAEPLKTLGKHPNGDDMAVFDGRYGPYVKAGKINATIPKTISMDDITADDAIKLVDAKAAQPAKKKTKAKKSAKKS